MGFRHALALLLTLLLGCAGAASAQSPPSAQRTRITLAAEDDWPPYSAAGASSPEQPLPPPTGFSVELIRAAFARVGVAVDFVTVPFARCLLMAKTAQVAGCFNATQTDDNRADYLWHSPPLFEEELAIFGRATAQRRELTLSDLRGQRVAYTNGYTYPSEFLHDSRITKFSATSDAAQLRMLISGRVDFVLLNRTPGSMRIAESAELRGQVVRRGRISMDSFWIAFSRQHPQGEQLAAAFGRSLAAMRSDGSYQRLLDGFRQRVGYR